MQKKVTDRSFQENLIAIWEKKFKNIQNLKEQALEAKAILEDMRDNLSLYNFDDDILDTVSSLVDRIMNTLNSSSNYQIGRLYGAHQSLYAF